MYQWPIASVVQLDDWGHAPDHPEYRLEQRNNYADHVPEWQRYRAQHHILAEAWNMTPQQVGNMPLAAYHEEAMLHRAITLRKPKYTGKRGAMEYGKWIREGHGKYLSPIGADMTHREMGDW